jgi:enoyl-CoA hydratase/carnithine racemase
VIKTVWLDNPPVNAVNAGIIETLWSELESLDDDVRVVVLRGKGERAFSAGADIGGFVGQGDDSGRPAGIQPAADLIERTPVPVVAAIHGYCLGGGLEIALACDFRIAADTAWFGLFEPKRGLVPGAAIQLLPRMLNYGDASWMLLTAARVDADEALRIGLVQKVVPAATLMDVALETAQGMCELSQVSLQMIKQTLRHHRDLALKESLEYGAVLSRLLNLGADVDEGIAAFREKRDTHFGNRWPDST